MRRRRWGRIVNQASDTFALNLAGFAHYIASKGGIIGLTRALASEFGEDGVTVNAIAPGLVRTPGTANRKERLPGLEGTDEFALAASHQSIKRGLVPGDLVGTLSFLTSDDAAFITGQTLYVNGGAVYV
jgi:(S)-1-phenylethanol dehydrogenase